MTMMARDAAWRTTLACASSAWSPTWPPTALCGELSLGSAIVAGEWVGVHERLGRSRPALRGFNSEKEASWTG